MIIFTQLEVSHYNIAIGQKNILFCFIIFYIALLFSLLTLIPWVCKFVERYTTHN